MTFACVLCVAVLWGGHGASRDPQCVCAFGTKPEIQDHPAVPTLIYGGPAQTNRGEISSRFTDFREHVRGTDICDTKGQTLYSGHQKTGIDEK